MVIQLGAGQVQIRGKYLIILSDADSAFQIFAREASSERWHSLSEIESSYDYH